MQDIAWWEHEANGAAFTVFAGDVAGDAALWEAVRRGEVLVCVERNGYDVVLKACEGFDAARGYHQFRDSGETLVDVWPAEELKVRPMGRAALEQRIAALEAEVAMLRRAGIMPPAPIYGWPRQD